jgi:hypothetical protein
MDFLKTQEEVAKCAQLSVRLVLIMQWTVLSVQNTEKFHPYVIARKTISKTISVCASWMAKMIIGLNGIKG